MPKDLESWLASNGLLDGSTRTPVNGGCISQAWFISHRSGEKVFVKYRDEVPEKFYEAEALGLAYLHNISNLQTPEVLGYGEHFIALRYISAARQCHDFWELLAEQLAHLHNLTRKEFGFASPNYCGTTLQINSFSDDGYAFFANNRLLYLADKALHSNLMTIEDRANIEKLCRRLPELIPHQPASLLHGDLWSGNVHISESGKPIFIDPAVYYGWAEIDLAMTQLFGGFPGRFYEVYTSIRPLEDGWRERLAIYNLYPLLNHLNLFGEGYLGEIRSVLKRFC